MLVHATPLILVGGFPPNFTGMISERSCYEEHSGSVVERMAQERGVAGSSLVGGTALCPWARHFNLCLVLVMFV